MRRIAPRLLPAALLGAAALVTAAPGIGAGGGAASRGGPEIGLSHGGYVLRADALGAGGTTTGTIAVANSGTAPGSFRLSRSFTGDAELAAALELTVLLDGRIAYRGSFARFETARLGRLDPGDSVRVDFAASLPRDVPAGLDGSSIAAEFRWDATQA